MVGRRVAVLVLVVCFGLILGHAETNASRATEVPQREVSSPVSQGTIALPTPTPPLTSPPRAELPLITKPGLARAAGALLALPTPTLAPAPLGLGKEQARSPDKSVTGPVVQSTVTLTPLLSDGQFVYGPNVGDFAIRTYLVNRNSPLSDYADTIWNWAGYASINPRVLLAILEARNHLVTSAMLSAEELACAAGYPSSDFSTQLEQLSTDLAGNFYYYLYTFGPRKPTGKATPANVTVSFADGSSVLLFTNLNAGTYALAATSAKTMTRLKWDEFMSPVSASGFYKTYLRLFPESDPLDESNNILPLSVPPSDLFQFPFPVGQTWWFNGPHNWNGDGRIYGRPFSSMDFGTSGTCSNPPNDWATAAAGGNLYHPSGYSCWMRIDHGNGWTTSYYHLRNTRGNGGVNRNDGVGTIACETCAGGSASGPHVHFSLLYNGAYVDLDGTALSGWIVHSGDGGYNSGYIERGGIRKNPRDWVTNDYGGTCSAPSLSEPSDGATLSSRTITFRWNAPSNCSPDGYTFRIKNVPDMDSGGTTIVDTGVGGTERTETVNGWDNTDLYWSVRACKPCTPYTPGPWAPVRRFRIQPSQPPDCPQSGGVILYKHANYNCGGEGEGTGYVRRTSTGWQDVPGSFNDQASSIRIPAGWSVRLYQDSGRRGGSVCRNSDDSDFAGDTFDNGVGLNDQISSFEVFDNSNCSSSPSGSWRVEYFSDTNLNNRCFDGYESSTYVFKDWGEDAPAGGCPRDNWSARFTRRVHFQSGTYTFGLGSDDWGRIKVGSDTVVDNWQGRGQHYESRSLSEGDYDVTVEFADTAGHAKLAAWWWGPGFDMPRQSQDTNQWYAQYWGNKDLWWDSIIRVNEGSGNLSHSWDLNGPGYGLPADRFSCRFDRRVYFECGTYRFHIFTDDGVRFWIDGQQKLDKWFDGVNGYDVDVALTAGYHDLRLEHYENGGAAAIQLSWEQLSGCVPAPPTLLSPPNGAEFNEGQTITLLWSSTGDEYYGEIWGGPGGTSSFGWQSTTSKSLTSLRAGYTYSWHIKARNSAGPGDWSVTWTFTVKPATPSNLSAQAASCNQVNLSWTDNSANEEGYKIYRNGACVGQVGANVASYQDTGLSENTSYSYYVKAFRGSIESEASNTVNITTPPCPSADTIPPTGRITSPSDNSATNTCPITVRAEASDEQSGVAWVRFWVRYGGSWHEILTDSDGSDGWSATWNCGGVTDQLVTFTIWVRDNAGNEVWDPGGYVYVTLDRIAPSVCQISSPPSHARITSNAINITAVAQDNPGGSGIAFVSFLSDYSGTWQDIGIDRDGSDGWSYVWDVSRLPDMTFSLYIFAFDRAGNWSGAGAWDITLDRSPTTFTWQQEAEDGDITPPMRGVQDATASNCGYVYSPDNSSGSVSFTFTVPATSSYYLWARVKGSTLWSNSFYVSMDGGQEIHYEILPVGDQWIWDRVHAEGQPEGPYVLTAGSHSLRFRAREANARLDAVLITNDPSLTPSDVRPCAAKVKVSPASRQVPLSGTFTVDVVAENATNLAAYQVKVLYDPATVHVTEVTQGPFLGSTGRTVIPSNPNIDNAAGQVAFGAFTVGAQPGASGNGVLATITFRPRSVGTSALRLQDLQLADPSGAPLPAGTEDGRVEVVGCFGDLDGDNDVDVLDLQRAASHWGCRRGDACYEDRFDTDSDGDIDILDLQRFASAWGSRCRAAQTRAQARLMGPRAQAAGLKLLPSNLQVAPGSLFTLTIGIEGASNVGGFQVDVAYAPSVIRVEGVTIGPFLGSTGRTAISVGPSIDHARGRVSFGAFTFGNQPGASGSGELAYITFHAQQAGSSTVTFRNAVVADPQGNGLPVGSLEGSNVIVGTLPPSLWLPLALKP